MGPFNGINTKIVQKGEGYFALVIDDIELAKQIDPYCDEDDMTELAVMYRSGLNRRWAVRDFRLYKDERPSPYMLDAEYKDSCLIPSALLESRRDDILSCIPYYSIGKEITSEGVKKTIVRWPTFDGLHMTQEAMDGYEPRTGHFIWGYLDAKKILSDLKAYWASFKGNSLEEARVNNPFFNEMDSITLADNLRDLQKK